MADFTELLYCILTQTCDYSHPWRVTLYRHGVHFAVDVRGVVEVIELARVADYTCTMGLTAAQTQR